MADSNSSSAANQAPLNGLGTGDSTAASPSVPTFPDLGRPQLRGGTAASIDLLRDVNLQVRVELGRTRMLVEDVLRLAADSVVELDKAAGDPVDIYVNGRHIARGEVLVLNETFCVRVSEIIEPFHDSIGNNLSNDGGPVPFRGIPKADVA